MGRNTGRLNQFKITTAPRLNRFYKSFRKVLQRLKYVTIFSMSTIIVREIFNTKIGLFLLLVYKTKWSYEYSILMGSPSIWPAGPMLTAFAEMIVGHGNNTAQKNKKKQILKYLLEITEVSPLSSSFLFFNVLRYSSEWVKAKSSR